MERNKSSIVFGIGINDSDYPLTKKEVIGYKNGKQIRRGIWVCPFYRKWVNMLSRCYSSKFITVSPHYKGCSVCEEWLTFSSFKAWMEQQDWEGNELDKDLLFRGNKVYSPETCIFITGKLNLFLTDSRKKASKHGVGVSAYKEWSKFTANCRNPFTNKREYLGGFNTPEEAHQAWLKRKLEFAWMFAEEQSNPIVAKALIDRYENYSS